MKEYLKKIVSDTQNKLRARGRAVEYCQERILQILQNSMVFQYWIFHGGTALRFLYDLPRYSEDLDFYLADKMKSPDFTGAILNVKRLLDKETYNIDLKVNNTKTVKTAFIRFRGLPFELGLSPHTAEVLGVKVELDADPPDGGTTTTTIVRRNVLLNLFHYDRQSLLAGKIHAILSRRCVKGRDIYDLFWYVSQPAWPEPNILFLNNALHQTKWKGHDVTRENLVSFLIHRLEKMDWRKVVEDVRPFIEQESDLALLTKDNVLNLLKSRL